MFSDPEDDMPIPDMKPSMTIEDFKENYLNDPKNQVEQADSSRLETQAARAKPSIPLINKGKKPGKTPKKNMKFTFDGVTDNQPSDRAKTPRD